LTVAPNQKVYNDMLAIGAQTPLEAAASSTQGAQSTKYSIAEVLGMITDILSRLDTLEV